jgi:hypothetical protein
MAFYSACGYHECDRVSLSLPVFKGFQDKAVSVLASLENNLAKQLANRLSFAPQHRPRGGDSNTTAVGAGSDDNSADNKSTPAGMNVPAVWMRKRLLDFLPSVCLDSSVCDRQIRDGVLAFVRESAGAQSSISGGKQFWRAFVHEVPWQQQVGPACGLAAIRMCCDASERVRERDGCADGRQDTQRRRTTQDALLRIAVEGGMWGRC